MRKLIITVALALMPTLFFAQDVFDKFEKDANVTSVFAGKKSFSMLAKTKFRSDEKTTEKGLELISQIETLRVYSTDNTESGNNLKTTVSSYAKTAGLEDLMQVNDSGKRVGIMIKEGATENILTQILVFVGSDAGKSKDNQTAVILLTGTFNLDELSEMLSDKSVTGDKNADDAKFNELKDAIQLKVSPNPASGTFYIDTDEAVLVKMFDLSGRQVKSQTYTKSGISVSDLTPATYIVEITNGDSRQTERIIIK